MPRFNGKPLVSRQLQNGIKQPEELIKLILEGKASAYTASEGDYCGIFRKT